MGGSASRLWRAPGVPAGGSGGEGEGEQRGQAEERRGDRERNGPGPREEWSADRAAECDAEVGGRGVHSQRLGRYHSGEVVQPGLNAGEHQKTLPAQIVVRTPITPMCTGRAVQRRVKPAMTARNAAMPAARERSAPQRSVATPPAQTPNVPATPAAAKRAPRATG
jgi:hypothetical protein